jgi:hypothetical protein
MKYESGLMRWKDLQQELMQLFDVSNVNIRWSDAQEWDPIPELCGVTSVLQLRQILFSDLTPAGSTIQRVLYCEHAFDYTNTGDYLKDTNAQVNRAICQRLGLTGYLCYALTAATALDEQGQLPPDAEVALVSTSN